MVSSTLEVATSESSNDLKDSLIYVKHPFVNYSDLLESAKFSFEKFGPYLMVNEKETVFEWVIYISVTRPHFADLFEKLRPVFQTLNVAFAIPENSVIHDALLIGNLGYSYIGKVIEIHPADLLEAENVIRMLINVVKGFSGPVIPTAYKIGSCLYVAPKTFNSGVNKYKKNIPKWPSKEFKCEKFPKKLTWINRRFYLTNVIKSDAKGNVYKALNLDKWSDIKWCIVKSGKAYQCYDDAGRDIRDRLNWQFEVQSKLWQLLPVPMPIDYIEKDGDSFLIMEMIEGESYNNWISAIQGGRMWNELTIQEKSVIIQSLLQAVNLIENFHIAGYLHRDLSPENFIMNQQNKLFSIDIELSYNMTENKPAPFFTLGTEGYMSPQQSRCLLPKVKDDIYGLGSLFIRIFSGISPTKFSPGNSQNLACDLAFFVNNRRIQSLICSCWDSDPDKRPPLNIIKHEFELYHSLIITNNDVDEIEGKRLSATIAIKGIEQAINGLWLPNMFVSSHSWYSKTKDNDPQISNTSKSISWYPEIYSGTAGILYVLSMADQHGYDLGNRRDSFYGNFEKVKDYYDKNLKAVNSGLYTGSAGMALLMAVMIKNGQLEHSINNMASMVKYLSLTTEGLNLYNGICGLGVAIIICMEVPNFPNHYSKLHLIAETIVKNQQRDGSWELKQDPSDDNPVKIHGLVQGISGIIYFLIKYSELTSSENSKIAAKRALNYLDTQRIKVGNGLAWTLSNRNTTVDPWLDYGFTGIAFVFIKAYEVYGEPEFKNIAVNTLLAHPKKVTSNYFSQSGGLSGLGEVYLEAYRVFKDNEWFERAKHINQFFLHTYREFDSNSNFWLEGSDSKPYPDFMSGNAGIIHFLLRFQNPTKLKFPVLSI